MSYLGQLLALSAVVNRPDGDQGAPLERLRERLGGRDTWYL